MPSRRCDGVVSASPLRQHNIPGSRCLQSPPESATRIDPQHRVHGLPTTAHGLRDHPPPPFVICLMGKSTPRRCPEAMHWKMGRKSQSAVLTKGVINSLVKSSHNNANTHYPLQIQFCAINISRRSAKCSTNIISFNAINENKPGELSRDSLTVARRSTSRFETWTLLHLTDLFFLRALVSKTEKSSTGAGRETPACSLRDAGGPAPASSLGERLRKHLSPHLPPAVPPSSPFLLPANVSTLCPIAASGRECSCELHPA